MTTIFRCASTKLLVTLLLIVSLITIAAPCASAFDGAEEKSKNNSIAAGAPETNNADPATESRPRRVAEPEFAEPKNAEPKGAEPKTPGISYVLYGEAMKPQPEPTLAANIHQLESVFNKPAALTVVATRKNSSSLFPSGPASSTAPLTSGEKFKLWTKRFVSPGAYGAAIASGLWNELLDNDEGKEDTVGNYFADAATRSARSFAFGTTAGFFEKFAYASLFHQDPRYHRSDKRGLGGKMKYAVSRVFITQGDRCGCDQFNISFLAGGLTAAGISNVWEREERQTVGKTISRWGTHIMITALSNIVREFIGGQ
jgi:hypothetical protein